MDYNPSANVHIKVIDDKSLSVVDKMVYFVICLHADSKTRQCSPKVAIIAARASCSEGAVRKSLATLEKRGIIHRKFRYVNHRQISSLYTVISAEADYYSGDFIPSQNNMDENNPIVEAEYLDDPDNEVVSNPTVLEHTSSIGDTENMGNTKMRAGQHQDEGVKKNLRIFNNSLKGGACLPALAEKESSSGNPEETKNSLTGEALLPSPQSCKPEEEQGKPQTAESTKDSTTENPVIKAECTENHVAEETGACLPAPAEKNAPPSIPEEKPLTQDEKLRRYYELRRKCEEEHRKAESEAGACLPAPAEKEATPEGPKASQTEGSTLPDYLVQQYEQKRKMIEEMMKPTKEPRYVSCDVADVVADIKKPRVIKAESEKATQTPVPESKYTDNSTVAKTEPAEASNTLMASNERVEHRDTPVAQARPMDAGNLPVARDRHIAKTDNAPELAETSDTPVAREEPPVPKEADKSAETPNKATDKGKRSGGGNSKDVYPVDYAPDIMRPTAEYFLFKTGRKGLRWEEVSVLRKLSATQYPTRVNKEIERACERFRKRNQSLLCLTLMYIEAALKNQPTWGNKAKQKARQKAEAQSEVVEKPKTEEEIAAEEAQAKAEMECIENYLAKFAAEREERRRKWLQTWTGMKS